MRILIPIIIGAIIGYSTNWLAIKMLFRPYYEKRILGIKIPFTPGLIPKERGRMAKSIGETVGVYLLSPDTIIQSLSNIDTGNMIKKWIENKANHLKNNTKTIKEAMENLTENDNIIEEILEEKISDVILLGLQNEEFKLILINMLETKVNNLEFDNLYERTYIKLERYFLELSNSKAINNNLSKFIQLKLEEISSEDRLLSQLVSDDLFTFLVSYINKNEEKIGNGIRQVFMDKSIQEKLKSSISDLVFQNMSKIVMAFVSPDIISEKIFNMIEKYINSQETNKDIIMIINLSIDKLLESKVSDIVRELKININHNEINKIVDLLIRGINNKTNHEFIVKTILEELKNSEVKSKEGLINYVNTNIDEMLQSRDLEKLVRTIVQYTVNKLVNKPINSVIANINDDKISDIYKCVEIIFQKFVIIELPRLIELFNISKIVEDKVNSFEVDFTEKLILDIAKRELKAITWLGALLGGFIGLLSSLLQIQY